MTAEKTTSIRQHYIDWLRVIGTLAVFLFHTGRLFDKDDWHVKDTQFSEPINIWVIFLVQWIMPLMFLISGISTLHTLKRRTGREFIWDRVLRLVVPLIFGIFTLIPPQVYIERITHNQFSGSFIEFFPHYFNGLYLETGGTGNFAWMGLHLWYLMILFLISVIVLPLLNFLNRAPVRDWLVRRLGWLAAPGAILLLGLLHTGLELAMTPSVADFRVFGGWNPLVYMYFFLLGYLIPIVPPLEHGLQKAGWLALAAGVLSTTLGIVIVVVGGNDPGYVGGAILRGLNTWFWIVALIGLCFRYLNFETPALRRANEAVLPFYILHQTVIVLTGWLLLGWITPAGIKYGVVAGISLPVIIGVYWWGVRPFNGMRFLFGMREKSSAT